MVYGHIPHDWCKKSKNETELHTYIVKMLRRIRFVSTLSLIGDRVGVGSRVEGQSGRWSVSW